MRKLFLIFLALASGVLIAYIDSRPTWDDTGVTAAAILITSAVFSLIAPSEWWLWTLCIGLWIPTWGILSTHNYASLLALAVALLGAVAGASLRHVVPRK